MFPARLLIEVGTAEPRIVTVQMAQTVDIKRAGRWKMPNTLSSVSRPTKEKFTAISLAEDNLEFASLAAKRWRHYLKTGTAATTFRELIALMAGNLEGEFCFFLNLTAPWFKHGPLGQVMLRRTWCHHIFMDFLYQHTSIVSGESEVKKGVGYALLLSVAALARTLQAPVVWGEATKASAPWYRRQFGFEVKDHFIVQGSVLHELASRFDRFATLAAEAEASGATA